MAGGGSSHQRRTNRRRRQVAKESDSAKPGGPSPSQAQPAGEKYSQDWTATGKAGSPFTLLLAVLSVALMVAGDSDKFPFFLNMGLYLLGLCCVSAGAWTWARTKAPRRSRQMVATFAACLLYVILIGFPLLGQYRRDLGINLVFKDSPQLTWWRRQVITHDLARFSRFLKAAGVHTPSQIPPIGISAAADCTGAGFSANPLLPMDQRELALCGPRLRQRDTATGTYANYVIFLTSTPRVPLNGNNAPLFGSSMMVAQGFSEFFNSSFWGKPPEFPFPGAKPLWKIRETLGADFANRLAGSAVRSIQDSQWQVLDPDPNAYVVKALKMGDSVVESNCERWPVIAKALVDGMVPPQVVESANPPPYSASTGCYQAWRRK